jgi:tetratricopeptide (TPR) repeat protein
MIRIVALLIALSTISVTAHADDESDCGRSYGEWKRMIEGCSRVIAKDPRAAWAYSNRSTAYERDGQFDNALADGNKAIDLSPKMSDAYANRGALYVAKGDYARALLDIAKAIELDGSNGAAFVNRGYIHEQLGERDRAIADYRRTLEIGTTPHRTVNLEFARNALKRLGTSP